MSVKQVSAVVKKVVRDNIFKGIKFFNPTLLLYDAGNPKCLANHIGSLCHIPEDRREQFWELALPPFKAEIVAKRTNVQSQVKEAWMSKYCNAVSFCFDY